MVPVPRAAGRPNGSRKHSLEQVMTDFEPFCHSTQDFSLRHSHLKMQLRGSKQQVCNESAIIEKGYKYRTVANYMRHGRAGIANAKNETGKCDVCQCWDRYIKPDIEKYYTEARVATVEYLLDYWDAYDAAAHPMLPESLDRLKMFVEYIDTHAATIPSLLDGQRIPFQRPPRLLTPP